MEANDQPALLGGPPVRPHAPPDWPPYDEDVQQALAQCIEDGSWGKYHGGNVEKLEYALAELQGVSHAATCASGTAAVELALHVLKVGRGGEVVLAAYDYSGNFLNVHAVGAMPVLTDVAPGNWNALPEHLDAAISPQTQAIIVSHLHGGLVPMREVTAMASRRGIPVIEDAAQATGAMVQGRRAGAWGDVGILSFGGSKLLTAGRGGALLFRDRALLQRLRIHVQRGNHISPLSELQAAVLLPQLEKLDARNSVRLGSVERLTQLLDTIPGLSPFKNGSIDGRPSFYKVGWQYSPEGFGLPRARFVAALRAEGVAFDEGFSAFHIGRSPRRFRAAGLLPEAERAHTDTVILHHPVLLGTPSDLEEVAAAVRKVHVNRDQLR